MSKRAFVLRGPQEKRGEIQLARLSDGPGYVPYLRIEMGGEFVGTIGGEHRIRQLAAAMLQELDKGRGKRRGKLR